MIYTKFNTTIDVVETELNRNFWRDHYSYWENSTFDFIFKYLNKDKTFIDIGSWIGPISLIACQHSKSCICFEPDPVAYNEFVLNIALNNFKNIFLENKAVSIYDNVTLGHSVLGHSETRDSCSDNSINCECLSLAEILEKYSLNKDNISVLKIDIEGHETELFQDKTLWELDVPMHLSLHPGWKPEFFEKVKPFLIYKKVDVSNIEQRGNFFDITIDV